MIKSPKSYLALENDTSITEIVVDGRKVLFRLVHKKLYTGEFTVTYSIDDAKKVSENLQEAIANIVKKDKRK